MKTKNGTKSAAKSAAKSKSRAARPSASASTSAAAPVAADGVFTDCPFIPPELRKREMWRNILEGFGAHCARRIVTEAGEDWRSFEELARGIVAGAIVPPTAAQLAEFFRLEDEQHRRFAEYAQADIDGDEDTKKRIEEAGPFIEYRMPDDWSRVADSIWIATVYCWFRQAAATMGAEERTIESIVQDAAPKFAEFHAEEVKRKMLLQRWDEEDDAFLKRLEEAKTEEERERIRDEDERSGRRSANGETEIELVTGRGLAGGLFKRATQYLERRLAMLLKPEAEAAGRLAPAWDEVQGIGSNASILAADALNERGKREELNRRLAAIGKRSAPRRTDEESAALGDGIRRMRKRVERGQSRPQAARATIAERPIPSSRAHGGELSATALVREYKADEKRKRDAERRRGAG